MRQIFNLLIEDQPRNRFLALKRYSLDMFGDMWSLPGRELEDGENTDSVAVKQFLLETGTNLTNFSSTPCLECEFELFSQPVQVFLYQGQLEAPNFHPSDPDVSQVGWIYPDQLFTSLKLYGYPLSEIQKFRALLCQRQYSF